MEIKNLTLEEFEKILLENYIFKINEYMKKFERELLYFVISGQKGIFKTSMLTHEPNPLIADAVVEKLQSLGWEPGFGKLKNGGVEIKINVDKVLNCDTMIKQVLNVK